MEFRPTGGKKPEGRQVAKSPSRKLKGSPTWCMQAYRHLLGHLLSSPIISSMAPSCWSFYDALLHEIDNIGPREHPSG